MTETLTPQRGWYPGAALEVRSDVDEPFDELKAVSRGICETAVDATDISVMLETGGITDAMAADSYGARDTLDLAEQLLRAVPTHATARAVPRKADDGDRREAWRLVRRGALYAAPGAYYVAITDDIHSAGAVLTVIGATTLGWMVSQIIALTAHRLTARTGPRNTHAALRRCLLASAPAALGMGAAAEPWVGIVVATMLAAQVAFSAAAAVLLFYDADRALSYCVIPGVVVAAACVVDSSGRWPDGLPSLVVAVAATATALATAATAWAMRSCATPPGEPTGVRMPTGRELLGTLPYVLYGMLCAVALISGPLIAMAGEVSTAESGLAVLPVVLGMGYGELGIRRLRTSCLTHASLSTAMRRYRRQARADLARLELRMAIVLAVITVATMAATWAATGHGLPQRLDIARHVAYLVLGCALVAGLAGCAFGRPLQTAAAFLIAFGAVAATLLASPLELQTPGGFLSACLLLLVLVNVAAARVVQNPIAVIG